MIKTKIVIELIILLTICSCQTKQHTQHHEKYFSKQTVRQLGGKDGFRVYDKNPVLSTGQSGEWDAGALGSMSVLKVGDVYHMYYEAWGTRSEKEWDAELLKADEKLYLMYFGPQGYFDRKGCDIRVAIYRGRLNALANR